MSTHLSEQELVRRDNLKAIIDLGIDPYPAETFEINGCYTKKQLPNEHQFPISKHCQIRQFPKYCKTEGSHFRGNCILSKNATFSA